MGDLQALDHLDSGKMPFEVQSHAMMVTRVAGKDGTTVLTIERNIFNYKVCEYAEPWSYFRQWCYPDMGQAVAALVRYLVSETAAEPSGWTRAIDLTQGVRRHAAVQQV